MIYPDEDEEVICLWFDVDHNLFIDEDGFYVWNIFRIITPKELYLFKLYEDYMHIQHRTYPNIRVELYYPEEGLMLEGYANFPVYDNYIDFIQQPEFIKY